jgi:tetratricopeptide (TPR) repeat protein
MSCRLLLLLLVPVMAGLPLRAQSGSAGADNAHYKQAQQDLDNGDASAAADEYEAALVADPKLADAHYELGVLYAEKLSEPVSAIYHLERYLKMAPTADHAPAARELVTTESEAFAASLPGSSSSAALAKLQIENANLRKQAADAGHTISQLQMQLAAANARAASLPVPEPVIGTTAPASIVAVSPAASSTVPMAGAPVATGTATAAAAAATPDTSGARTYTVVKGDVIWKIAKRMYPGHTKEGVDKIEEANKDAIGNKPLKIGQVLIIPEL